MRLKSVPEKLVSVHSEQRGYLASCPGDWKLKCKLTIYIKENTLTQDEFGKKEMVRWFLV
jgi:hypothetical protein